MTAHAADTPPVSTDYQPSLASGKAPWWKVTRPRLAAPPSLTPDSSAESMALQPSQGGFDDLQGSPSEAGVAVSGWRRMLPARGSLVGIGGAVAGIAAAGAVVTVMLWLILSVTILPTPTIDDDRYLVKWGTWPQGQVPVGATVVTHADPIESGLGARLGYILGDPDFSIVEITGDVRAAAAQNPELTRDTYLAVCVTGACPPGEVLIPVDHVMGELLGRYQPPFSVVDQPERVEGVS